LGGSFDPLIHSELDDTSKSTSKVQRAQPCPVDGSSRGLHGAADPLARPTNNFPTPSQAEVALGQSQPSTPFHQMDSDRTRVAGLLDASDDFESMQGHESRLMQSSLPSQSRSGESSARDAMMAQQRPLPHLTPKLLGSLDSKGGTRVESDAAEAGDADAMLIADVNLDELEEAFNMSTSSLADDKGEHKTSNAYPPMQGNGASRHHALSGIGILPSLPPQGSAHSPFAVTAPSLPPGLCRIADILPGSSVDTIAVATEASYPS